jgi:hypothetical protein
MADVSGGSGSQQEQESKKAASGTVSCLLPSAPAAWLLLFSEDYPIPVGRGHKEQQR